MPVLKALPISDALKAEIARSIEMHTFVVRNVPDSFTGDTDEKILVGSYFSLVLEHHGAILHSFRQVSSTEVHWSLSGRSSTPPIEHIGFTRPLRLKTSRSCEMARSVIWASSTWPKR